MVYNLSIEGDETYTANGFVVHNCRSTIIPAVNPQYAIPGIAGERPSIGAAGKMPVSGTTTFESWLRKQPAEFQDEYFGDSTRGALFRRGGLTVENYRDDTGKVYNLDQLRELYPVSFQRAGLTQSDSVNPF